MTRRRVRIGVLAGGAGLLGALASLVMFVALFTALSGPGQASACTPDPAVGTLSGAGGLAGATEYGGPGDPASGTVGSSGVDLLTVPDSYAELGGVSFTTATAMGGLAYGTPLRISWGTHSLVARKEDIGLGGGPIDGRARVIDLWWELAGRLGIPYENGRWSGTVRIAQPPTTGAGALLGATPPPLAQSGAAVALACASGVGLATGSLGTVAGPRAELLPGGQAAAPAVAPAAVKAMIAAGNQIAGRPYLYGGGHGLPLSELSAVYDCSSSVSHLLWGGGLLGAGDDLTSGELESWGTPGPGRWVTIYASPDHVFMYVAGMRWDTWDAAGPGDGSAGIGWHPLVRAANGFIARHPPGL